MFIIKKSTNEIIDLSNCLSVDTRSRARMSEQRRQLRVKPEDGNPIRVDINGENFVDILYANDISEGGLNVSVPHQFQDCEIDTPVSLMVQLPTPISHAYIEFPLPNAYFSFFF